jgi:hypothetical protein
MGLKRYLLSVPERVIRSAAGLGAGFARELAALSLPPAVRRSRLYQNIVDTLLRYLIEEVGGVEGVYPAGEQAPAGFLTRRAAGNVIELAGYAAFRASPVWVLAALADVCGLGRHLIPEIAGALKADGLLDPDTPFTTIDQVLDGLERTSARMADTINTPPLDIAGLRHELAAIRDDARRIRPGALPSRQQIVSVWQELQRASIEQQRSVFQTSSLLALSATRVGLARTGQVLGTAILRHYATTLDELRRAGFAAYARTQLAPYARAAAAQFSPGRRTLTDRLLDRI